jgi:hypothetical protein
VFSSLSNFCVRTVAPCLHDLEIAPLLHSRLSRIVSVRQPHPAHSSPLVFKFNKSIVRCTQTLTTFKMHPGPYIHFGATDLERPSGLDTHPLQDIFLLSDHNPQERQLSMLARRPTPFPSHRTLWLAQATAAIFYPNFTP